MNNDLISREALKETLRSYPQTDDMRTTELIGFFEKLIDNAQAVGPERPKGEWLHNSDRPDNLICSVCNCGWDMWRYERKELKYCPNCGSDMGEAEE